MNEVKNGLFLVEEAMPCSPRKIRINHYLLPVSLNTLEQEEAAARIISFSCELDQWVGVSWSKIVEMMEEDYAKYDSKKNLDRHNGYMDIWFRHFWLCVLTLGVYALFARKPQSSTEKEEQSDRPFSGIYLFGPRFVVTGVYELLDQNMLTKVSEGVIDVLFPTPTLISCIMEVQGITA